MKIGLVRHFKVDADYPAELTAAEYIDWLKLYDERDVIVKDVDLRGIDWNRCYASSLPRAYKTAQTIFDGEIEKSDRLVEVNLKFRQEPDGRKSVVEWGDISTDNWAKSTGVSGEDREDSHKRIEEFLDRLEKEVEEDDRILIVCHELIIGVLEEELKSRGFVGENTKGAKNGQLFLFER